MSNLNTMTDKALLVTYTILYEALRHARYPFVTPLIYQGLWKMYYEFRAEFFRRRELY